jgi:hypothetical protein
LEKAPWLVLSLICIFKVHEKYLINNLSISQAKE